jgi:hypothetical protein
LAVVEFSACLPDCANACLHAGAQAIMRCKGMQLQECFELHLPTARQAAGQPEATPLRPGAHGFHSLCRAPWSRRAAGEGGSSCTSGWTRRIRCILRSRRSRRRRRSRLWCHIHRSRRSQSRRPPARGYKGARRARRVAGAAGAAGAQRVARVARITRGGGAAGARGAVGGRAGWGEGAQGGGGGMGGGASAAGSCVSCHERQRCGELTQIARAL